MAHVVVIELTKEGAVFTDLLDAVDTFNADHVGFAELNSADDDNSDAELNGELTQTHEFNAAKDGFTITRTWSDEKWAEISSDDTRPTLAPGWSRTVK